jgi:hypothetical protein
MIHTQVILAAVRIGSRTSREISVQTGIPQDWVMVNLYRMVRSGMLWRVPARKTNGQVIFHYLLQNSPEAVSQRSARVERMNGWTPTALAAMRGGA